MPWTAIAWTPSGGQPQSPHGTQSKHARQFYDNTRKRVVIGGGDRNGSDAGQPDVWHFTPPSGNFTNLRTETASGKQPAYPDNCTWAHDTINDKYVIAKAFWFGLSKAQQVQPARPQADWLLNNGILDPVAGTYSTVEIPTPPTFGWGGDSVSNFGVYDPVLKALLRCIWDGSWGFTLQIIPLGDLSTTFPTAYSYSVGSGYPSGNFLRGYLRNTDAHGRQHALDVNRRHLYVIAQSSTTALQPGDLGWGLIRIDLQNPTMGERITLPPEFDPQEVAPGDGSDNYLCYDSLRDCLIHPQVNGYGGEVKSTLVYYLGANPRFELHASNGPPYPQGNCFCFDPNTGVAVLTGGKTTTSVLRPGEPMVPNTHYFTFVPGAAPPPVQQTETVRVTAGTTPLNVDASIIEGFYRFTVAPHGGAVTQTIDTASPTIRSADFANLIVGNSYDFTGVERNAADNANIGSVITLTATITGTPVDPPDPIPGDITPPTVVINSPTSMQSVVGVLTPDVTVSDASGIFLTEYSINDVVIPGPSFDTTTIPNGNAVLKVRAQDNSVAHNETIQSVTFVVNNPAPPDPPDPPVDTALPQAIWLSVSPTQAGYVEYLLWVETPQGFESVFAKSATRWEKATAEEGAMVEAGLIAETMGILRWSGTDAQMQTQLLGKLALWQAHVESVVDWALVDSYFDGDAWTHR